MPAADNTPHALLRWLRAIAREQPPAAPEHADAWQQLLTEAEPHGCLPLLHRWVAQQPDLTVSATVRQMLQAKASAIAAKNLLLASELHAILQHAQTQQISCLPIRGVALAEQLYGNLAMRPTGDIDFLVRPADLEQVRALMRARGFTEVEPRPGFAQAYYYTLEFMKSQGVTLIAEPHWTLAYPPFTEAIDMAAVWRRARPGTFRGQSILQLSPEDLLMHLCLHWLHHRQTAPLLWSYEMDQVMRRTQIDWSLFQSLLRDSPLAALVTPVLREVCVLFERPVPEALRAPSQPAPLSQFLATTAVRGPEKVAMLINLRGARAKARYALSLLCPSRAFIRAQYGVSSPISVSWIYVTRACALVGKGLAGLFAYASHR